MFEVVRKFADAGQPAECPVCKQQAERIFSAVSDIWHCDGAHKTDYGKGNFTGSKIEALNRAWSKYYKEPPPPPARDVPKNSGEKY